MAKQFGTKIKRTKEYNLAKQLANWQNNLKQK